MDLFTSTTRPDSELFYQRNDPNDRRLGEHIERDPAAYDRSQIVILGCPQDEGVARNKGRTGAAQAPAEIRRALYKLSVAEVENLIVFDLGDTQIQPTLEQTHETHAWLVERMIHDGKTVISLGGGNDVSYPDCVGLARVIAPILAFNIDAHLDVRADTTRNSGTPYRQLLEERYLVPQRFYEIGWQRYANSPVYVDYLRRKGVWLYALDDVRDLGLETVLHAALNESYISPHARALFWGIDMDSVRASDAPGVSAPNPTGLNGEDLCTIATLAGSEARTRVFEISEVNPQYDIDAHTSRLAAAVIWHFLAAYAQRTKA